MLKLLGALLCLAACLPAKKADLTALEVYEKALKAQAGQAWLQCTVVREEKRATGAAERVSGTLKVAAGGKALLEIPKPSYQKAVSDGKFLFVEMADVKQVMKYDAAQLKKGGNFFLDLGSSIRHYAKASLKRLVPVGEGEDESKTVALELMPLHPDEAGFDRMRVWLDRDSWGVRQVELSLGGVQTRVSFRDVTLASKAELAKGAKQPLPARLFKYAVPKGYQVFDLMNMQ